jgi:hypothetical protein
MGADMSNNIRLATPVSTVPAGASNGVVDHWAQVIAVAQPTLNMIVKVRQARDSLKAAYANGDDYTDRRNNYLEALIGLDWLQEAKQLFEDAACRSAPEPWFYLAIGAMLRGMPNAKGIAPDYSSIVVDMLLYDHETQERGCEPGFSAPIFISALRRVRRETEFVPSAAEILKACVLYRQQFRELAWEVESLIGDREELERELRGEAHIKALREKHGWPLDNSDVPF